MYSNKALAKFGRAAYFDMFNLARLIKGPSGVDNMDAWKITKTNIRNVVIKKHAIDALL
jgi:hypothetical protein